MRRLALGVLLVLVAIVGCTGGGDEDSLPTDAEARGWTVHVIYPNETERSYNVTSDPTQTDTDGDGLNDFSELEQGTDPRKVDTDHDRLLDGSTKCPDEGSDLYERIQGSDILEHPDEPGCYLGESRTEVGDLSYRTTPRDAHSDSSPQISDGLDDGTEIEGWQVELVDGETYHVRSNPGLRSADTDSDGLHDGLEKELATDPTEEDTDGDDVNDQNDAAPLGDITVTAHVRSVDLKSDYRLGGGANLIVDAHVAGTEASKGPERIERGPNELRWALDLDVSDQGSAFTEEMGGSYAAGNWDKEIQLTFSHDGEEPIEVRNGDNGHLLRLQYDVFADEWTGHADGGTSSGPDADVTVDVTSRIE